jgi:transcriptional regulator with XRE-family HTH domain
MEPDKTAKVQLDGSAIRRFREQQKLTQFYIAKVVGVTTDTVSRWENNRYPSVRRENALLLSEALEVPVEEILLAESSAPDHRVFPIRFFLFAGAFLIVAVVAYFLLNPAPVVDYEFTVQRLLPPHTATATKLPVGVSISVTGPIDGMVLRENFPSGFTLVEASPPPSSLDNVAGSARWILQSVPETMLVSYLLQPDDSIKAGENLVFKGELIVNSSGENKSSVVAGKTAIRAEVYHWADTNRDLIIDDGEALDASVLSIAMKNIHIDWDLVEDIWDAGRYRLDPGTNTFIAVHQETE